MTRFFLVAFIVVNTWLPGFSQNPTMPYTHAPVPAIKYEVTQYQPKSPINDTSTNKKGIVNKFLNARLTPTADLRTIDGISLGLAYKIQQKEDGSFQKVKALKSILTKSLVLEYAANWKDVFKNTDIHINGLADIKGNIMNFYGLGNDSEFNQTGDFRKFYRVNFSLYEFEAGMRFNLQNNLSITAGPIFQHFVTGSNEGRYFNIPALATSIPDLYADKLHGGLFVNVNMDKRNHILFPSKGFSVDLRAHGFEGFNNNSHAFGQAFGQFSFFIPLTATGNLVLANRTGGGITKGKTAFYQSAFLGSQDNLLGFRKHRFAGDHVLYNNIEGRLTIPNFLKSVFPGSIGLIAFYDTGRVWLDDEDSDTIHHGLGAGAFVAPFDKILVRGVLGYSKEGFQPTVSLRQRF